jgi:DNA-binding MarR family transcriptional regulator
MHIGKLMSEEITAALADLGVHHAQGRLLSMLAREGALPQAELARGMGIRPPTLTKMLRPLEERGLLERHASTSHGRIKLVKLTRRGRMTAKRVEEAWDQVEHKVLETLPRSERRLLRHQLEKVRDTLGGTVHDFSAHKETR